VRIREFVDNLKFGDDRGAAQEVFRRGIGRGLRRGIG
jgi:hypothetical protein